ncbi:MAG: hypothetical protein ACOY71_14020, partial [Gemmatimonadota bacterium]
IPWLEPLLRRARAATMAAITAVAAVTAAAAQDPAVERAFGLERRASYAEAVEAYKAVLAARPNDISALLGLERSLTPLKRLAEVVPLAQAAIAAGANAAAYGTLLRGYLAADRLDSVRATVERWAAAAPGDETPYREWGGALLQRRDRAGAREAYLLGRKRLDDPGALAADLAEVALAEGDFIGAAREWVTAMERVPGYRMSAVSTLAQAPPASRTGILQVIDAAGTPQARRLGADLAARFGDPIGGFERLKAALPSAPAEAAEVLRQFVDQVRVQSTPDAWRATAMALELLAARQRPDPAARTRLEAAQAYAEAGDRAAARRLLDQVADQRDLNPAFASGVSATLIAVLLDEGKVEEAERRLAEIHGTLAADEYDALRRRVLRGWVRQGEFDRVEQELARDSTVESLALAGKVRLYRGDLAGARTRFAAAGPFAGTREEATSRASLLALLQPLEQDTLPELGRALWQLERGDTAKAVDGLVAIAGKLSRPGAAELTLLAGRLEAARGHTEAAERLLRAADTDAAPTTAPAAELELAKLFIATGRAPQALELLEHLVLTYPTSALAPQARRLMDVARGAVPKT